MLGPVPSPGDGCSFFVSVPMVRYGLCNSSSAVFLALRARTLEDDSNSDVKNLEQQVAKSSFQHALRVINWCFCTCT